MPETDNDIRNIKIFDTTLRDGEQSPGATMTMEEKLQLARQLARLGVDIIEAGFAIASDGDFNAVRLIAAEVEGPVICSLARAKEGDIKRAWEAVKDAPRHRIHTFHSSSDIHLKYQYRIGRDEALKRSVEMLILLILSTITFALTKRPGFNSPSGFFNIMRAVAVLVCLSMIGLTYDILPATFDLLSP